MRILAVLALLGVLAGQDGRLERAKDVVRPSSGHEVVEVAFEGEKKEKIAKALGEAPGTFVYVRGEARLMFAENLEPQEIRIAEVECETEKGKVLLGVAVAPEESMLAGVKVLRGPEDLFSADSLFLSQFQGRPYSPSAAAQPPGALEEMRRKAREGDRKIAGLLGLKRNMYRMQEVYDGLIDAIAEQDERAVGQLEELVRLMKEAAAYVPDADFLENPDRVQEKFDDAVKRSEVILEHARAGEWGKAKNRHTNLVIRGCTRCHGSYQRLWKERRDALGLGDGYFRTDYDLLPDATVDEKLQNQVGAAVRRAVLLLHEAPE